MTEQEVIAFYRAKVVETALDLPLRESAAFLRGALTVAGNHEAMGEIRSAYMRLNSAAEQLELIEQPRTSPAK
jgi:hypothetical protein